MIWMKFLFNPASPWVALALKLVIAPGILAGVEMRTASWVPLGLQPYISNSQSPNLRQLNAQLPPPPKNPDDTKGGGTRSGGTCSQDEKAPDPPLTTLSPVTGQGLTVAEHPTFLVYVPQTTAQTAELSLSTRNNNGIYRTTIAITNTPGILSFSLPPNAPPLEIGKDYIWSFAMICDPKNRLEDQFVRGTIRRSQLEPALMNQINKATPKERVFLYKRAGIWYEAVSTLFELRRSQPNDPSLSAAWKELLNLGGLDPLASQPLSK